MKRKALEKIRNYIKNQAWHKYLVILPTPALVQKFIDELFNEEVKGVFYPKIYTFDQFVGEVLSGNNKYIGEISKIEILKDVIDKLTKEGRLNYIGNNTKYGIIQFIAEAISELKQFAIDAEKFTEAAQSLSNPKVTDLALIYITYEAQLQANGLKDNEDRFLDLLYKLENEDIPLLKDVDYFYADWFIDNTLIQDKIFETLQRIIPDSDAGFGAYGKTSLDDITRLYPPENKSHLANVIYSHNSSQEVLFPQIGVFSESGREGEVIKVLNEVIRLLENNVSVNEIAIVARNPQEYADILLKWFDKIDVPLEIEVKKPLLISPVVKSLMLWFDLAKNFNQKSFSLDILLDNYYLTDDFECKREVLKWCSLQGEHTLQGWMDLWKKGESDLVSDFGSATYNKVLEILEHTLDLWSSLPPEGPAEDIIGAIKYILEKLNIEKKLSRFEDNISLQERVAISYRDNQAFNRFREVINNLEEVWAATNRSASLSGVLSDIRDYLTSINFSYKRNYGSGIKVLSPTEIRGLKFHSVFVLGMEQNKFPKLVMQNPLLKDHERLNLRSFFYIPLSIEIYEREKLLFYLVIQASAKELFLTYSATNEEGQPNLKSLFIEDVLNLIPEDAVSKPYTPKRVSLNPSPYLTHLLNVEAQRNSTSFSAYEGCFKDQTMLEKVRANTYAKTFSISTLNNYAKCPMKYFMVTELGLTDEKEAVDGISKPELGSIKHEVLARVLTDYKELDINNLVDTVADVLEKVCEEKGYKGDEYPHQWLWELEKVNIIESLSSLIEMELQRGTLKPCLFEWRFGNDEKPFYLEVDDKKIPIRGIIDRIDKDEEGHYAVYDYKDRVSTARKDIEGGRELQLPIYIMAVEQLLGEVVGTSYLDIREGKAKQPFYKKDFKEKLGFDNVRSGEFEPDQWESWLNDVKAQAVNYVKDIANGYFPTIPHSCLYCHLEDICLYKPSRVRLKKMGGE